MQKTQRLFTLAALLLAAPTVAQNTAVVNVQVQVADQTVPTAYRADLSDATLPATGTGAFVLKQHGLFYRITVSGLSGPITAAHFHNAAAGANGPPVRTLTFDGGTASGTWRTDETGDPLTPALLAELKAGRIYVNVHTAARPAGEIRGQLTPAPDAYWSALSGEQVFLSPASLTVPANATGPATDRIGFPTGYKENFQLYYKMDRLDNQSFRAIYANAIAASTPPGQPFPPGSILVMETHRTTLDPLGNVATDDDGRFATTGAAPTLFVMKKDTGFGEAYGDLRNGDWEYVAYRANGTFQTPPQNSAPCANCHLLVANKDYVFRRGLAESQKNAHGTALLRQDGNRLHYRITVSGLSGPVTSAGFHTGKANTSGTRQHTLTFTGGTASGTWDMTAGTRDALRAGSLYIQIATAGEPEGALRGQVFSAPGLGGLEVALSRSIAGVKTDFAWKGTTNAQGRLSLAISDPARRAGGYYLVKLTNPITRVTEIGQWGSLPVQNNRQVDLLIPVGATPGIVGPTFGVPIQTATKPVAGAAFTPLSTFQPTTPTVGPTQITHGPDQTLTLSAPIANATDIQSAELHLTFDPRALTLQSAHFAGTPAHVIQNAEGDLTLAFSSSIFQETTALQLTFHKNADQGQTPLTLTGQLRDTFTIPTALIARETHLNLSADIPKTFALYQNTPNPFNPTTAIRYDLPEAGHVTLTVYTLLGQQIARLVNTHQAPGAYTVHWDAAHVAAGTYVYVLQTDTHQQTRKLILLK